MRRILGVQSAFRNGKIKRKAKGNNENSTEAAQGLFKKAIKHSAITKTRLFQRPGASDLLSNFLEIVTALFHDNCGTTFFAPCLMAIDA